MNFITPDQWAFYDANGYLKLGKLLSGDELAALQQRIDEIMPDAPANKSIKLRLFSIIK